ncbi:MAG: hypothetical protein CMB55_07500 [Euryarchaeota archaeon]|nr:hypothetical protein [Euryarchaeota archaeon]
MASKRQQAALGLFFVTLLWGGTFVWMKLVMNSLDSEIDEYSRSGVVGIIVSARFFIAFALLLPFSVQARSALKSKEDWKGGLILGSLMLPGFVLQMIGLDTVSPAVSAFLTSLYVVFTAIFSVKISDRKPTRMMIVGVALATIGAGFIDGVPHIEWGKGEILTVMCAIFFALHIIYTDKITKQLNPIAVTSTSFLVVVLGAFVISLIASSDIRVLESVWQEGVIIPLLCLGIFGSLACILLLNLLQRHLNPTHAAIIYSFEPVWATLYGWQQGLVEIKIWLAMGLLLLLGNILVELDESGSSNHLSDEAGPE